MLAAPFQAITSAGMPQVHQSETGWLAHLRSGTLHQDEPGPKGDSLPLHTCNRPFDSVNDTVRVLLANTKIKRWQLLCHWCTGQEAYRHMNPVVLC